MLQLVYLNVSKVDQALHVSSPPSVASFLPVPAGIHTKLWLGPSVSEVPRALPLLPLRVAQAPRRARNRVEHAGICSDIRALALP
jgi:hypothetical protein